MHVLFPLMLAHKIIGLENILVKNIGLSRHVENYMQCHCCLCANTWIKFICNKNYSTEAILIVSGSKLCLVVYANVESISQSLSVLSY